MKKDFTYNTYQQILKYISEMEQSSLGSGMSRFFGSIYAAIYAAKAKAAGISGKAAIEDYYRKILDYMHYQSIHINKIFSKANALDAKYAQKFGWVYDQGEQLLQEIQALSKIATPKKFADVRQMPELKLKIIDGISDKALIEYCNEQEKTGRCGGSAFSILLADTQDVLGSIGVFDEFLITLFNYKEIIWNNLVKTPKGQLFADYIVKCIIGEIEGYPTISDIAERLDVPKDYVLYLLGYKSKNDVLKYIKDIEMKYRYDISKDYLHYEMETRSALYNIMAEIANKMINDESLLEQYLASIGVTLEYFNALRSEEVRSGEVSGSEKEHYKELLGGILDEVSEAKALYFYPDEIAEAMGFAKIAFELGKLGKRGEYLKKAWENGILSYEECKEFLRDYCGVANLTNKQIKAFRKIGETFKGIEDAVEDVGKFLDILDKGQSVVDALSPLWTDYLNQLELLDSIKRSKTGDSMFQIAVAEMEKAYKNKVDTALTGITEMIIKEGVEFVVSRIPILGQGIKVVNTTVSTYGKVTGASDLAAAAWDTKTLYGISSDVVMAYEISIHMVNRISHGEIIDIDMETALWDVRNNFEVMKKTLTKYYETQIKYYEAQIEYYDEYAFLLGADADKKKQDYLKSELSKIQNLKLGDTYTPETYEAYRLRVS